MFEQEFYDLIHRHVEVELQSENIDFSQELSDAERSAIKSVSWNTEEYFTKLSQLLRKHAIRRLDSIYQKVYRITLSHVGTMDHEINVEIVRILSFYAEPQKEYLGRFLPKRWKELSI